MQDPITGATNLGYLTFNCLPNFFQGVIQTALSFVGITCAIFIIIAGFKLVSSQGDAKKIAEGRNTLTFALIGLVVVILSFTIIHFFSYVTGLGCLMNLNFGTGCTQ